MNIALETSVPKHALLVDPNSGKGLSQTAIIYLHELCKTHLGNVALFAPTHSTGMKQITDSLSDAGCKSFIVVGGNDTINLIADRLITAGNSQTSICLLDGENVSDLSRSVWAGIPDEERLACLSEDRSKLIDTLAIEDSYGKTFVALNGCSLGASATVARAKDQMPLNWPRWTKNAVPTLKSLVTFNPIQTQNNGEAIAIIFSNGKYNSGGMQFAPEADLSDGKFNVTTVRPGNLFSYLSTLPRLYSTGLKINKIVEKSSSESLSVTCKKNVLWEHDGSVGETRSLTVRCNPKSLRLVVPRG